MGRSKTRLELIQHQNTRKNTFLRRKAGLIKKISELSTLCDIKACLIVHQHDIHGVEIWPADDPTQVAQLINLYRRQTLQEGSKRTVSLSNFFENQRRKVEKEGAKLKTETAGKYPTWDSRLDSLSAGELRNLARVLEEKIEKTNRKLEFLNDQETWDYPELMNQETSNNNFVQEISDVGVNSMDNGQLDYKIFQELMNNGQLEYQSGNEENWLVNHDNRFFQEFMTVEFQEIPSVGVNSMSNRQLDYQFGNAENWLVNNDNRFFQHVMTIDPSVGVSSMENRQLTVGDYQIGNYAENWLVDNDINGAGETYFGLSSTFH